MAPEKRSRSGTTHSNEGDDDSLSTMAEGSKLEIPHHQSQVSIISMDEDDFLSDEEKVLLRCRVGST